MYKINYNSIAGNFDKVRWAWPWILESLDEEVHAMTVGSRVIELGCGTGNYIYQLASKHSKMDYYAIDNSDEMLKRAKQKSVDVAWKFGDLEDRIPFESNFFDLIYCIDVIHHLNNVNNLFRECRRLANEEAKLVIVTEDYMDIKMRGMAFCFPELIQRDWARYTDPSDLIKIGRIFNWSFDKEKKVSGYFDVDFKLLEMVDNRFSSALLLLSDEEFRRGRERLIEMIDSGERWLQRNTILQFSPRK